MLNWMLNIQHRCNPLHVHCRLVERGFSKQISLTISRYYGIFIYSWLAGFSIVGVEICRAFRSAG